MAALIRRIAGAVRRAPSQAVMVALRHPATHRWLPTVQPVLESVVGGLAINPFDPAFNADPYPAYRRVQAGARVYRSAFGPWFVTRFDDATAFLADPRFVHPDYREVLRRNPSAGAVRRAQSLMMITMNPPEHARVRRVVGEAFAAQLTPDLRARVARRAEAILDEVAPRGRMDLAADFAVRLPVWIIGEIFGLSLDESLHCHRLVRAGAAELGFAPAGVAAARADAATDELAAYFGDLLDRRSRLPGRDFMSALLAVRERESDLTREELIANCMLMFGAGYETTSASIGTGVRALLEQRDAWAQLCDEPALVAAAVDEVMRIEPAIKYIARQAREDLEFAGARIGDGQTVAVLVGAANRDPARFRDPDRIDLTRQDGTGVTFGQGAHACLGRSLSRLEGQVSIEALARRLPGLRLAADPPVWRRSSVFRTLDRLVVEW